MSNSYKGLTQKQLFGRELKAIKGSITEKDRADYMAKDPISKATLSLYLNGTPHDLDRAARMLKFFKKRIANRNKALI